MPVTCHGIRQEDKLYQRIAALLVQGQRYCVSVQRCMYAFHVQPIRLLIETRLRSRCSEYNLYC